MPSELILFHKGLSSVSRSALQEPGTLKTCVNISLEKEGEQTLRMPFAAINTTAVGSIHSIYRFRSIVVIGDGKHLRFSTGGDFTDIGSGFTNSPWRFKEYKDFLHGVNGYEEVLIDASGNCYPAKVSNPASAPTGTPGAGGTTKSTCILYVSYLITFPNGMKYETGLSDGSADVAAASKVIGWASIPTSAYAAYYGTAPTIHRKLYRGPGTGGTLTDIYYVTTLANNSATTYTDDNADATIIANDASYVDDYDVLPTSNYIEYHYGRAYVIDASYPHRLCFSEVASDSSVTVNEIIMPIAHESISPDWDDIRVSGFTTVDPQGIVSWGTNIFIALKQTWIRKQGNDPDTWSYKKTWAHYGVGAPDTISQCPQPSGIIALSATDGAEPGLCIFNGQTSEMFSSPKLDYILSTDLDHTYIANCRGFCAGRYYHLIYPSHDATAGVPDKWLAIDMRRFPDIRVAHWEGLAAQCGCCYDQGGNGGTVYIGTTTGYVLKSSDDSSTEDIDVEVETADRIGGGIEAANMWKVLKELRYNLIGTASLQIIIDGAAVKWPDGTTTRTITGTEDAVQVMKGLPPNFQGHIYSLKITATDQTSFTIFSPWTVELDVK